MIPVDSYEVLPTPKWAESATFRQQKLNSMLDLVPVIKESENVALLTATTSVPHQWPWDATSSTHTLPTIAARQYGDINPLQNVISLEVAKFLNVVYSLSFRNQETKAVDEIFNFMDDRLQDAKIRVCDEVLAHARPEQLMSSLIVSLLMVTVRAKPHLPSRAVFHRKAIEALKKRIGLSDAKLLLDKYA